MKLDNATLKLTAILGLSAAAIALLVKCINNNNNNSIGSGLAPFSTSQPTISPDKKGQQQQQDVNNNNNNQTQPTLDIGDIEDLNKKCGFCRPEMVSSDRADVNNSIHEYNRHYFICSGTSSVEWPSKWFTHSPELMEMGNIVKKHDKSQLLPSVFNGTDIPNSTDKGFDVLVFPESVKLIGLTSTTLDLVLEHFSKHRSINSEFPPNVRIEALDSRYIFVCTHKQKDERCGYCGPILVEQLQQDIKKRGLEKDIKVFGTSHVGGHKYAGNLLVFPPGIWYGYATPSDVPAIIDSTLSSEVIPRLHRGTMGQPVIKKEKKDKDHRHKH